MTKKLSEEEKIARLKIKLYPIDIAETRQVIRSINLAVDSSQETIEAEIPIRVLISKDRQRFFMEYNSKDGLLNLVDFDGYEYDRKNLRIVPIGCLNHDATYDLNEAGEITRIYLHIEEALTSPFRLVEEGILEKSIKREDDGGFWIKRLKLVSSQETSYLVLSTGQEEQQESYKQE